MKYNFDAVIDRKNTDCLKTDTLCEIFGQEDLISLWIADMDFESPPCIIEAIKKRVEHGVFGYTQPNERYYKAIIDWLKKRHNWSVNKEDLSFVPGVVKGFAFAIDAFTEKNDGVIIQPPVYPPFHSVVKGLERKLIYNPLLFEDGKHRMDFVRLKRILAKNNCKMLILCNPHNPGGRVWKKEELSELADICFEYNVLVVSDEIHSDLIMPGFRHTPFCSVSEKSAKNNITFMAPSKTFNIAGFVSSFAIIKDKALRQRYFNYLAPRELYQGPIFSYLAAQTAYESGEEWLEQALEYIHANIRFVDKYLKENIPQIKAVIPEASFLIWLDCRALGLSQKELVRLFVEKAHLALNDGTMFGKEGEGFMRMNVGSPRTIIEKALKNFKKALIG